MDKEKYALTEEDIKEGIENFFTQLLVEAKIKKPEAKKLEDISSNYPKISYIVGQPGAGKTSIEKYIKKEYEEKGECTVEISADKVATYHKYYDELLKLLPDECYSISRKFVTPACEKILKEVQKQKLNVIRECAFCKGEQDYRRIEAFKNAGYDVEVNIIAVDRYESFLSCIERDVKLLELGYEPRPVTKKNHDNMYEPFLDEVAELNKRGICDNVKVFTRGKNAGLPELVYENGYTNYSCAQEAVRTERANQRKRIIADPSKFLQRITLAREKIESLVKDGNMRSDYVERLKDLEDEYLKELSVRKGLEI